MKKLRHPCIVQFLVRLASQCATVLGCLRQRQRRTPAQPSASGLTGGRHGVQGACTRQPHMCIITQFVARGSLFRILHRWRLPPRLPWNAAEHARSRGRAGAGARGQAAPTTAKERLQPCPEYVVTGVMLP